MMLILGQVKKWQGRLVTTHELCCAFCMMKIRALEKTKDEVYKVAREGGWVHHKKFGWVCNFHKDYAAWYDLPEKDKDSLEWLSHKSCWKASHGNRARWDNLLKKDLVFRDLSTGEECIRLTMLGRNRLNAWIAYQHGLGDHTHSFV